MLYLGIDRHARQLTVAPRDEGGDVLLARQVSTEPDRSGLLRPDGRKGTGGRPAPV